MERPIAGIAMGLIKEGERFAVLSDILGDEDHLGDMDFKVAGTEQGVTALQMDIKITGITEEIMKVALGQAKDGRLHILTEMGEALTDARDDLGVGRLGRFQCQTFDELQQSAVPFVDVGVFKVGLFERGDDRIVFILQLK